MYIKVENKDKERELLLGVMVRVLLVVLLAPFVLGLTPILESTGCGDTWGNLVRSHSGLVHYPFILPAALTILCDLIDTTKSKRERFSRILFLSILICLLLNKFLIVLSEVIGC